MAHSSKATLLTLCMLYSISGCGLWQRDSWVLWLFCPQKIYFLLHKELMWYVLWFVFDRPNWQMSISLKTFCFDWLHASVKAGWVKSYISEHWINFNMDYYYYFFTAGTRQFYCTCESPIMSRPTYYYAICWDFSWMSGAGKGNYAICWDFSWMSWTGKGYYAICWDFSWMSWAGKGI